MDDLVEVGGAAGVDEFTPSPGHLQCLMDMGFTFNRAVKGLYYTGNDDVEKAITWICEHENDAAIDDPLQAGDFIQINDSSSDDEINSYMESGDSYKMVCVVNSALGMGVGKVATQVAHGCLGLYRILLDDRPRHGRAFTHWEHFGEAKIVLKGQSVEELVGLEQKARTLGLPTHFVHDAGKTQVEPGSMTVLAIFGRGNVVDEVTGELPLL